jgi:uncharacterized protein (TIGR00375 family)
LEECFEEEAKNIFAIETGLSSDIDMNRRVSALDPLALISNSDSHSPRRLGREANVLDCDLSFTGIMDALRSMDKKKFLYTIEFFPDEGRYHYDGHRDCKVSLHPREAKEKKDRCPVCFKPLTLGVMHRVEDLADKAWNFKDDRFVPQRHAVPLDEIIAETLGVKSISVKVSRVYEEIMAKGIPELPLMLESSPEELARVAPPRVVEGILRVRKGQVTAVPGYDGEYGIIKVFKDPPGKGKAMQAELF